MLQNFKIARPGGVIVLCFLLLVWAQPLRAQDTLSSAYAGQRTLELYMQQKWPELARLGNRCISAGYDYFYMRMRVGIAYYEMKNYSVAERHFRKALSYSSADTLALEYLYYCYVYNGNNEQARLLSRKFPGALQRKTGVDKQSAVDFVMVEAGTKITDSVSYYDRSKRANTNFFDRPAYFQLGLNHYIRNRLSLFYAFTYFNQSTFLGQLIQKQYYVKAAVPFRNNWLISPAFHLVDIDFRVTTNPARPPMPGLPPPRPITIETRSTYYVASVGVQKTAGRFAFSLVNTLSDIFNVNQYLHAGMVSWYVLGNSKIVLGCTAYLHTTNNYSTLNSSVLPYLYLQPVRRFSVKVHALFNSGTNIIEDNGYLVNNSPDLTQWRAGVLGNLTLTRSVSLYALYQLESKLENVQEFHYKYNVILAGIKITPFKS